MKDKETKLTPKQEKFCQMFAKDRDCFGNGTQSYLKVYNKGKKKKVSYRSARTLAYVLLTNVDIISRIRVLIDTYISDEVVDKELGTVILQQGDLSSKVAAIREYNKVKGRLAPTELKITDEYEGQSDGDIEARLERIKERRRKIRIALGRKRAKESVKAKKKK